MEPFLRNHYGFHPVLAVAPTLLMGVQMNTAIKFGTAVLLTFSLFGCGKDDETV